MAESFKLHGPRSWPAISDFFCEILILRYLGSSSNYAHPCIEEEHVQFSLEISKPRCYVKISLASYRTKFIAMARLFTCADVLEQLEDSDGDVSSGNDSAYEGEGIVGYLPKVTSFMPDADELSGTGTEEMHDALWTRRGLTV